MQDSKRDKKSKRNKSGVKHSLLKYALCSATSLFMLAHAFATEQSGSMDAANMFGKNASSDGQITICSDSLSYSQNAHKIIYQGNVLVMQTKDANIQCSGYSVPNENSKWPVYQFPNPKEADGKVDYTKVQKAALDYAKDVCKKQNGCRFLTGQKLTILFDDQNKQVKDVVLTANTPYIAKFYSLPFPKQAQNNKNKNNGDGSDQQTVYAEGRQMNFNMLNSTLTIQDKAYVDRAGNRFSGDKVLYDTKNGLVTVPNTGQRATVILNNLNSENSK
ncbi:MULTISPECIES: LptA/OstA family protein [Cysteiniphilum]|uniref:LptA/OstA family protein n=1 Tax=Cysteiniphilum TaxID=2056696 RepID=UPI0017866310|nr:MULTISPECIES: LptA/OstA family protein [Cysteiniphilum]